MMFFFDVDTFGPPLFGLGTALAGVAIRLFFMLVLLGGEPWRVK
jgi:hypothetical protein